MKRRISLILAIVMIAALFVPMSLTVSATEPGANDVCEILDNGGNHVAYYTSLAAAGSAVGSNQTIKILKDIVNTSEDGISIDLYRSSTQIETGVTIDGCGHTLFSQITNGNNFALYLKSFSNSTVKNLTIMCNNTMGNSSVQGAGIRVHHTSQNALIENVKIYTRNNSSFSTAGDKGLSVTLKNCYIHGCRNIFQYGSKNATINLVDTIVLRPTSEQANSCVFNYYCNSNTANANSVINIYNTFIYDAVSVNPVFNIAEPSTTVNIYSGYFGSRDGRALIANRGTFNIYGGTFRTDKSGSPLHAAITAIEGNNCANADDSALNIQFASYATAVKNQLGTTDTEVEYNNNFPKMYYASTKALPEMQTGAGVRIVEDSNGIRFKGEIPKELIDYATSLKDADTAVSYGTIIVPTDYLSSTRTFTKESLTTAEKIYAEIPATSKGTFVDTDGNVIISAALVNLKSGHEATNFSAVCYLKYIKNGQEVYIYSNYDNTNRRSMKQVATAALADETMSWTPAQEAILNGYKNA